VLFKDESRFPLIQHDGFQRVWRHCGEQVHAKCCPGRQPIRTRFCDGVGGISIDDRTDLVIVCGNLTATGCIEQMLLQHVLVATYGVGPKFVLMHDNARAHVVCITRAVLRELEIQEME
jgi:hypothetical protein